MTRTGDTSPGARLVVLTGFPGAGKSTVGRLLARRLGCRWTDLDGRIERLYAARHGAKIPVRDIYARHGAAFFRTLEREALGTVLADRASRVLALGAGAVTDPGTMALLEGLRADPRARVVALTLPPGALYERLLRRGLPRTLDPENPRQSFERLYGEREPLYRRIAHWTMDTGAMTPQQLADELGRRIEEELP